MRKVILYLLLAVICSVLPAQAFQEEAAPRYSLAFNTSQGVRVASLLADDTWRVDRLPSNVYFAQFDMLTCFPVWSPDGQRLIFMVEPEISGEDTTLLSQIGSYDVMTRTFQIHATLFDAEARLAEGRGYDGFCIDSISPDGRYVWLNNSMSVEAALVDLQADAVITIEPYLVRSIAWHEDRVFVSISDAFNFDGRFEQYVLSLPGGESIASFPAYQEAVEQYASEALWIDDNRIVFTIITYPWTPGNPSVLGIANVEQGTVDYLIDDVYEYSPLRLSENGRYLAYEEAGSQRVVLLDVDTLEPFSTDGASVYYDWRGNTLVTLSASAAQSDAAPAYTYAAYEEQALVEEQVLDWDEVNPVRVSPDTEVILAESNGLSLYRRDSGLLAGPVITDPEGDTVRLWNYLPELVWGSTRAYFGTYAVKDEQVVQTGVAIDMTTGELSFAPQGYLWVGESPDGRWALLAGGADDMAFFEYNYPELLAYSLETGETVPLFAEADEVVYNPIHFDFGDTLRWSPG